MMKLYLLYEEVCERYGCELYAYGIFTSKEKAEEAKEELRKDKGRLERFPNLFDFDTIMVGEFEADECTYRYLGGYEE